MITTTQHYHRTSEQHEELDKSRCQCDFDDLQKMLEWLDSFNPLMEQGPCYNLCYLDWLQMSQLTMRMWKKLVGQFIQNLTMHLFQNAPSEDQIKLNLLGS